MPQAIRTAEAAEDLIEIWRYVAANNATAADRLLDKIDRAAKRLAGSPRMGRGRDELSPGLRSFPVGKYLLFFRAIPDGVEIVRVLHGARDLPRLFRG